MKAATRGYLTGSVSSDPATEHQLPLSEYPASLAASVLVMGLPSTP